MAQQTVEQKMEKYRNISIGMLAIGAIIWFIFRNASYESLGRTIGQVLTVLGGIGTIAYFGAKYTSGGYDTNE